VTKLSERSIWILEDDAGSRFVYEDILGLRYRLRMFERLACLEEALKELLVAEVSLPSLLVADIRLPDESFLRFLEGTETGGLLRRIPFLVVSSVDDIDILRLCFSHGARDYITKPFGKNEFIVKVERLVDHEPVVEARAEAPVPGPLCSMDPVGMAAVNDSGERATLTSKEYQILSVLRAGGESGVLREDLTGRVWEGLTVNSKTLDIHIVNLRRKLSPIGLAIEFRPPGRYALAPRRAGAVYPAPLEPRL
jgi:DNA-binding response OmpR family regulator